MRSPADSWCSAVGIGAGCANRRGSAPFAAERRRLARPGHQGQRMARGGEPDRAARRVDHAVDRGREDRRVSQETELRVDAAERGSRIAGRIAQRVEERPDHRHHDRGRSAMARHVRDDEAHAGIVERHHIVVIAARVPAGAIVRGETGGHRLRQHQPLQLGGVGQLPIQAIAVPPELSLEVQPGEVIVDPDPHLFRLDGLGRRSPRRQGQGRRSCPPRRRARTGR